MSDSNSVRALADGKLLVDHPTSGVVRLTISNPRKRNALDLQILDAITTVLEEEASPRSQTRCVVVTGTDGMFSAGYEIGEIGDSRFQDEAERLVAHPFTEAIEALEAFPYPTLASLSGHTIGGGLELALACDLRLAADNVKLGMPPAKLGLVYSHTGLRRFLDTIGAARTRELFLLGTYIDAHKALGWTLVNRICTPEELGSATLEMASELVANAPLSQQGNKRVIAALLDAAGGLPADTEAELIELRRASFDSEDLREGMSAFAEKRAPRWSGR
ncbi:MAG: enoyl-CoA hydratase-related protein [Solirubrobacteraceae bacterium]